MIISPGRRYIFVHIPKTGGTSLALALEARAHRDDILIGDTPKARKRRGRVQALDAQARGRLWKHASLADIDGIVSAQDLAQFFCFCLVRNPWNRVVSYYHWLKDQSFGHRAVVLAKQLDFADFLRHPHTQASLRAWPYGRYMRDIEGVEQGRFVRLEHLDEEIADFEMHLGFALEMPHVNRSDRGEYRGYYTSELREIVAEICAADIARFGYRY